jgi:hypothetical protein
MRFLRRYSSIPNATAVLPTTPRNYPSNINTSYIYLVLKNPFIKPVQCWVKDFKTNMPLRITTFSSRILNQKSRPDIFQRVRRWHLMNGFIFGLRTKSIGEVRGSGRKVLRQKGTGKARQGMNRSSIRRGGNVFYILSFRW